MNLQEWQQNARAGERFIYHTGHLAFEGQDSFGIAQLGAYAADLYQGGWFELAQARHEEGAFNYYIIKRRERAKRAHPWMRRDLSHDYKGPSRGRVA